MRKNRNYKNKPVKHIEDHLQDTNQKADISSYNTSGPFVVEEPEAQLIQEETSAAVEPGISGIETASDENLSVFFIEEAEVQVTNENTDSNLLMLAAEEPAIQVITEAGEPNSIFFEAGEPDVQVINEVNDEPITVSVEEPDIQLIDETSVEDSLAFTNDDQSSVQLSGDMNEKPLFLYIYESNVQLSKEVMELRNEIQQLAQKIVQLNVRTEINAALELFDKRYDGVFEQMAVQQRKIDEMTKLLWWKPEKHPGN